MTFNISNCLCRMSEDLTHLMSFTSKLYYQVRRVSTSLFAYLCFHIQTSIPYGLRVPNESHAIERCR